MAPQFKRLTDCPEKLRESIDWLIQIKNGGDKTGLEKLAKALDMLINKAVEDAQNSLKAEEEKLKCPIIYEGNLSYCQFNEKSFKEAQKKLDELKDKQDPESESRKKRLGEEVEQFKLSKEKCIQRTHPRYPESQALKDVRAKLKAFQELHNKLEPFLNKLNKTTKNDRDSILHNLCDGFETFLGFDAATKGYTGKGIVYSDLDRLCDAVMAFLHECLKENESLLKHYNPSITENIEALKGAIGKGSGVDEFTKVIENVNNGLHGYERELGVRTKKFVDHVESLFNALDHKLKQIADSVSEKNLCRIQSVFNAYVDHADIILKKLHNNGEVIRELDDNLKAKLSHTVELIHRSLINVGSVSQSSGVLQAVNAVQAAFDTLPVQLENYIITNVATKISGHDSVIKQLKTGVEQAINGTRDSFLIERLKVAKDDLGNALDCAAMNALNLGGLNNEHVKKAIAEIENQLQNVDTGAVVDHKTLMNLKNETVTPQIEQLEREINQYGKKVKDHISGLNKMIKSPTDYFQKHGSRLGALVVQCQTDLLKALVCADKHAKTLGGLRNAAVYKAISQLEARLKTVDKTITTKAGLDSLAKDPVQVQLDLIDAEINDGATAVNAALRNALQHIEKTTDIFNNHKVDLERLVGKAQKDLVDALQHVVDFIKTNGGLYRAEIAKVFTQIEEDLKNIEKSSTDHQGLFQMVTQIGSELRQLEGNVVGSHQIALKSSLQQLNTDFSKLKFAAEKRSTPTNAEMALLILETKIYAVEALYLAEKYSVDSDGNEQKGVAGIADNIKRYLIKLDGAFSTTNLRKLHATVNQRFSALRNVNGVFKSTGAALNANTRLNNVQIDDLGTKIQEIEKSAMQLIQSVKSACNYYMSNAQDLAGTVDQDPTKQLKDSLMKLDSKIKDHNTIKGVSELKELVSQIDSQFAKLRTTNHGSLRMLQIPIAEIQKHVRTSIVNIEYTAFQTVIDVIRTEVDNVLESCKKIIEDAEQEYKNDVVRLRGNIEMHVEILQQKANNDELHTVLSAISEPFEHIITASKQKSVFQKDAQERESYFESVRSKISNTVETLQKAYQNAYASSAKSYLSGAIRKIKDAIGEAENQYGSAVDQEVNRVRTKISELSDTRFNEKATRSKVGTTIIADFPTLEAQINKNSAFTTDFTDRRDCFNNLKKLITDAVMTLSSAYEEAYKFSGKTYLNDTIQEIRDKVNEAENTYKSAVEEQLNKVRVEFKELKRDNFKNKVIKIKPVDHLEYHHSQSRHQIENNHESQDEEYKVEELFTATFQKLQEAVKDNSAFKKDLSSRQECFSNLKELVDNIIDTLVKSVKTFDTCAGAAKNCLDQSFTDAKTKMNTIGFDIRKQMNEVFEQVISAIYAMYSEEKKAELETLRKCFAEGCEKVKDIIYNDKVTGIKGLMQTLAGVRPNADTSHATSNTFLAVQIAMENKTIKFSESCSLVKSYFDSMLIYIWNDIESVIEPQFPTGRLYKTKVRDIRTALDDMFNHLIVDKDKIYHYDHTFVNLLEQLKNALADLSPQEFGATAYPLLDALRKGLNGFTEQLGYAYINKYVGSKPIEWHGDKGGKQVSQDALRCARIFLTLIPEWDKHLPYLRRECIGGCSTKRISLIETDNSKKPTYNSLGDWFRHRGYVVSNFDQQEGELINNDKFKGTNIRQSLSRLFTKSTIFNNLLYYLYEYYKVCQIKHIPGANPPTTVSQMLHWLAGLQWNAMYENMKTYLQEWYNDFKKEHEIEQTLPATVPKRTGHEVVTDFNLGNLVGSFENVTIRASEVLLTILGYGDADGRYACEFYTNPYNVDYPTDKNKCFDMLVEICFRLNHQLRFLYMQCHNGTRSSGWADCRYGKHIAGSAWNCNRLQCVEQGCDQNCKWHNDCGVKSPLQSFLEDGLKGFLPHQFSSPSCKLECSVKNHNGIPCKTPMGFADISITASWTKTGSDIKKVLDPFCGRLPDSLSLLCAYFLCLLRRPPQTLCDMFAFYENFFEHWKGHYDSMRKEHVKKHKHDAFKAAVASANFGVEFDGLDPTTMFGSSSHSGDDATHLKGDLFAVVNCKPNENPVYPCGSYLQPLSYEVRCVFTEKLAADYLSWIVYITETFYDLLNDLYNKCTKCCIRQQADCYGRICAKGCTVDSTPGPAGTKNLSEKKHGELCNSIVQCAGIHLTIFAAGFTFGSPWSLSGDKGVGKKRSCNDFCTALGLVVKENNVLYMLVHEKIPEFLWEIRHKFFYTLVALWSYSLLYLLYVIIARLDTLHIRSHLRLPSSHKIAAQSLLATARLNNLAKLAYLRT